LRNLVALEPKQIPAYAEAIEASGASLVPMSSDVEALVWTDYARPDLLVETLEANPQVKWVQLPFAGVDAFSHIIQRPITFTSAKRSYSEPVAEHALMLAMALGRVIPQRVKATGWGKKFAASLYDEQVLIVGGGGIAQELVKLLAPFRAKVSVVRLRTAESFDSHGIATVYGFDALDQELAKAKFVFLTCALTDQTRWLFDARKFGLMRSDSYLVNIARGEVVDQDALLAALDAGLIAGAGIDVAYPEPLPDGHPLFGRDDLIVTPHTADTMGIVQKLFAERLRVNVSAWLKDAPLTGVVDPELGY
jgi:phosphoglycerate dehydrogenase-like enzyme